MAKKKPKPPEPHPDLDHQWRGVNLSLRSALAEIQREWETHVGLPFRGVSREALADAASFAGLPAADVDAESPIIIYRKAIAKAKQRQVAVKSGGTLRLVPKENRDDMVGPFEPSELAKRIGKSLSTLSRMRKAGDLRIDAENTRRLFIHRADLARYEKK
jgi:hypothetical protein